MQFLLILFPIFCIFIVGFIAQKTLHFDIANLSKMSIYVLSPFLAFKTFYTHQLTLNYIYYAIYVFALCFILIGVVYLWGFLTKSSIQEKCAMVLASCFMNNGNYGTPVILVFFGSLGFDLAVIMMVLQQFVMNTVGIYFAVKGSRYQEANNQKGVWMKVLKMPVAHAAILGIFFQLLHIPLTQSILVSISLIGDASVVVIMIILGMQLANLKLKQFDIPKLTFALCNRMVISPIIAFGLASFMPIDMMTKQILIILAAMPTAANTTLLSVQFDTKPAFVSSATFISTIISLITLPVVLWLVNAPIPIQ